MARFESKYTDAQLERIVRTVVEAVDAESPTTVRPGDYDAELAGSAWPDAPKSAALRKRWKIEWYDMLEVIYDPNRDFQFVLRVRQRRQRRTLPGVTEIIYALKLIAAHL